MNRRKRAVDGKEAGGADGDGENQAEADQRKKAERINPLAAAATRSSEPAGAGGSNVGAVVEAILTAGNPAAQEEIADLYQVGGQP